MGHKADIKFFDTPYGKTFIKSIGQGPLVFVLHGGPGFTHDYLVDALTPLAMKRTLVFYDQPGCGQSSFNRTLSPKETFAHFRWLSSALGNGEQIGIIAHSWGCLVFIAAMLDPTFETMPRVNFQQGLLINPVPISAKKYKLCGKNLTRRMNIKTKLYLSWLALTEPDGARIMETLLPFYVSDKKSLPSDKFELDKNTYLQISKKLKNFDYASNLDQLPSLQALVCSDDFITPDLIDDLIPHFSKLHKLDDTGHFPFWEKENEFQSILLSAFE